MSEKPVQWALQRAPSVPAAKGKPAPASCRAVLIGLAWHADKQGRHAFPAVSTLVAYTDLGERTVRACLDRLAEVGLIRPCDPAVVAAAIPRADRRPDGYDLAVERHREVQTSQAVEVQTPHPAPDSGVQPSQAEGPIGVQSSHPDESNGGAMHAATGCRHCTRTGTGTGYP